MVKRVGVIGGGQLAWMMAGAAEKLGIELVVQTPSESDPAVGIAADTVIAAIDDASATVQLANQCDVITFENEFVNLEALMHLEQEGVCFYPNPDTLQILVDKYRQRFYLKTQNLPVPQYAPVTESLRAELATAESIEPSIFKFPIVLKTRRFGYDGQGTFILKDLQELQSMLERLKDIPCILEEFVPFERELAVMAARSIDGQLVTYPVVETQQESQVCRRVFAPAAVSDAVASEVETIAHTLLNSLNAVGMFGIELFLTKDGKVLVNEIAPRTHNSGHFTLDACETSQFEQQLRAVCGLPLGQPTMHSAGAVMVNLLGYEHSTSEYLIKRQQLTAIPDAHLHWYGKTESRPGRKLGHVTVLFAHTDLTQYQQVARAIESIWYGEFPKSTDTL